jgi:hypothetical protein
MNFLLNYTGNSNEKDSPLQSISSMVNESAIENYYIKNDEDDVFYNSSWVGNGQSIPSQQQVL